MANGPMVYKYRLRVLERRRRRYHPSNQPLSNSREPCQISSSRTFFPPPTKFTNTAAECSSPKIWGRKRTSALTRVAHMWPGRPAVGGRGVEREREGHNTAKCTAKNASLPRAHAQRPAARQRGARPPACLPLYCCQMQRGGRDCAARGFRFEDRVFVRSRSQCEIKQTRLPANDICRFAAMREGGACTRGVSGRVSGGTACLPACHKQRKVVMGAAAS